MSDKPRLRWDYRRLVWREWNEYHKKWMTDILRRCPLCGGQFIGAPNASACLDCRWEVWDRAKLSAASSAHKAVHKAKRDGALPQLDGSIACVDCGSPAECYDHRDYDKPLEVDAVCLCCNRKRGPAKGHEAFWLRSIVANGKDKKATEGNESGRLHPDLR